MIPVEKVFVQVVVCASKYCNGGHNHYFHVVQYPELNFVSYRRWDIANFRPWIDMFGDIELKVSTQVTLMSYSVSNSTANRLRWLVFKADFKRN